MLAQALSFREGQVCPAGLQRPVSGATCRFWRALGGTIVNGTITMTSSIEQSARRCEVDFGIRCADWLRSIMNRIDPDPFMDCFTSCVAGMLAGHARPCGHRRQRQLLEKLTALNALYLILIGRPELSEDLTLRQLRSRGVIVRM
jgi:hypothetical protein